MQGGVVQVIIDDSTDKVVTGYISYDSGNGGKFIGPSGTTFPTTTEAGEWFLKTDTDELYRRNDADDDWDLIAGGGTIVWGDIGGTLSDQTDLQSALDDKADDSDLTTHTGDATIHFTEASIDHNDIGSIQGGGANEYYHFTEAHHTDLTDSGDSSLHYHSSDRDRANHSGTQTASTISDFGTSVSGNTDVAANTAARHDAVTVADSAEIDFTLTGQEISASIVSSSIDETKLDASVNASLDLADSAIQAGDLSPVATSGDHTDLSNIGTNTHAQIDTHISTANIHFTEASISHANISNIGTNSHVQIDTHIADSTIHFTEASLGLGDLATLDTVDTLQIEDDAITIGKLSATGTPSSSTYLRGDNTWAAISGTGDVVGPASVTDNQLARFDGTTGKLIQAANITVDDNGNFYLNTNGSDSTTPRVFGAQNFSGGEAIRWEFGDAYNSIQNLNGGAMTLQGYHTLILRGNAGGTVPSFSTETDIGTWIQNVGPAAPALVIEGAASQTADLTIWRDDTPTVLARMNEDGALLLGNTTEATDGLMRWTGTDIECRISGTWTSLSSGGGAGTGDVVGPASATDNAIARFNTTTGKLIQDSDVTISDAGVMDGVSQFNMEGATGTNGDINLVDEGGIWSYGNGASRRIIAILSSGSIYIGQNSGTGTVPNTYIEAEDEVNFNIGSVNGQVQFTPTNATFDIPINGVEIADHSDRHGNGGADEISVAGLSGTLADAQTPIQHALDSSTYHSATSDTTTFNATTSAHGLLPKLSGDSAEFLNGVGGWVSASGNAAVFPIWAEESAALSTGSYQWSYGNGDVTPSGSGIQIPFACELFAIALDHTTSGSATVRVDKNGASSGGSVSTSSERNAYTTLGTPIAFAAGDVVNFYTVTGTGSSSGNRVVAWFRANVADVAGANEITVRKDSGSNIGTRPRLNFIEGSNVTLTVADDGTDNEVDITIAAGDSSSPLTTKGDLYTYSTVDARLPVGTNDQILVADSAEATGLKWQDKEGLLLEFAMVESLSNTGKYYFSWRGNSTGTDADRSGATGGLQNPNSCSPIHIPFDATIVEAILTVKGVGVQNASVSYPVSYQTELRKMNAGTNWGTPSKLGDIDFSISNTYTVGTFAVGNTKVAGLSTSLDIDVDQGDMVGLYFDYGSGASIAAMSANAFITLRIRRR